MERKIVRQHDQKLLILSCLYEQDFRCYYCNDLLYEDIKNNKCPHIDHKIPVSKGGSNEKENLCLTCVFCNNSKYTKSEAEFVIYIKPYKDKICSKKELSRYHKFLSLSKEFA